MTETKRESASVAGGVTLEKWCGAVGQSVTTAYRWIKLGMIEPVNILGKFYVTADEDARFWARAKAGEFIRETVAVEDRVTARRAHGIPPGQ
jgi:predicted site-specific integrase-resolvase